MRLSVFHGSPGEAFEHFDPARGGSASGYEHAREMACFTSSVAVAQHYAHGDGFIGRFLVRLENPLILSDHERAQGIPALLAAARADGHDGVILDGCGHDAYSPGESSTLVFLFEPAHARREEVLQEGPSTANRQARVRR
jgi:hypothetical protein